MNISPLISFGLYALEIKQDSAPSATDVQPFVKISDLRTGDTTSRPFASYETNFWLLDGGYKFLPMDASKIHAGLISLSMSDSSGNFATPPVLTITFSEVETTDSLTILFSEYTNDYAASLIIAFYDSSNTLIRQDTYSPTSWEFTTGQFVSNFQKIIITFNSTSQPYRYLRVSDIDYGTLIHFTGSDVKSCSVVEEIDPISAELPINTLDLTLFSDDADFSMINPSGDFSNLAERQPVSVREVVGNQTMFIGVYYLDTWANTSDNIIEFNCQDLLGILDTMDYDGGIWLSPINMGDLIDEIMGEISAPYELDSSLYNVQLSGWLPICTYREALHQIALAGGAYVTCARSGAIVIHQTILASNAVDYDVAITKANKGSSQSLTQKVIVTGVEVTSHNYSTSTNSDNLYNGSLDPGTYKIAFNQPMHDLTITGGTITSSGANYAIISVATSGTVILAGQEYTDTSKICAVYNTSLSSTAKTNVIQITDATLVSNTNGATVAQQIYDYYQQRYIQNVKLYSPVAQTGNLALVDTLYNKQIIGVVEKMELDLSGGFTSQTEIVGVQYVD